MNRTNFTEILHRYRKSGQTQRAFCLSEELPFNKFQYYFRRYGKDSGSASFIPIKLTGNSPKMNPSAWETKPWLRLTTAKGMVLEFSHFIEVGYVKAILGDASV